MNRFFHKFLAELELLDFAGEPVVHATAGTSAIVFVTMLGKRRRYPQEMAPPHNPGLTVIGASLLWVSWFGCNAGSTLPADGNAVTTCSRS